MKRVIIVHGLSGSPESDFLPWAKEELEKKGYEVIMPSMPDPDHPQIETWVPYLKKVVGEPKETDVLVGHSVGCQTILRYLENLPESQKVDKVILVAGWFSLTNLDEDETRALNHWIKAPMGFEKIKIHANKFIAILSDNDLYVPLEENRKVFEEQLGANIFVEHGKGHFNEMPQERPNILELFKDELS